MIQIHASKALRDKLAVMTEAQTETAIHNSDVANDSVSRLSGWHGHVFTVQRRNCVLLVHNQTRFPLLMIGFTQKEFKNFGYWFEDALFNTLLKLGANEQQLAAVHKLLAPLHIQPSNDRSVQGTLNQMKGDFEHSLCFNSAKVTDLSAYKMAVWLAERPCTVKGQKECIWPKEAMLQLLTDEANK